MENKALTANSGNPQFEQMMKAYKKDVSRHSLPECKSRKHFMTKKEAKRIRRGKPRKQSSLVKLFEDNKMFMAQLGLRISYNRKNRKANTEITPTELDTIVDYVIDEPISIQVADGAAETQAEQAVPQIEEGTPSDNVTTSLVVANAASKKQQIDAVVARRLSTEVNYVTVFTVIRFVPETEDQTTKFALVWNLDRQWPSFPGGGIEPKENLIAAAIRENTEEVNLNTGAVVKKIGRLPVGPNAHVALFAADLPYSQIGNIKWGIEQRPEWEPKLKAVTASFVDKLVSQGKLMPNHIKTWEFYKRYYLKAV